MDHKVRRGTSGISGHLYETKLISLILFRLLCDDSVEEFYLASNMEDVGDFDDICLKVKMKGEDCYKLVFIQAKHKDNNNKQFSFTEKDLIKWSDSIQNVKQKFSPNNQITNIIFGGKYDDTECSFILYTNAKYQSNEEFKSSFMDNLKPWIVTAPAPSGNVFFQLPLTDDYIEFEETIRKSEISKLAKRFAKFLGNKSNQMYIMNDEYILRYHTLLAKNVVYVSQVQWNENNSTNKWRVLTFKEDFFNTKDNHLASFRNQLFEQIIINELITQRKSKVEKRAEDLVALFLCNPTLITLRPLLDTQITYNNHKLHFVDERPVSDLQRLEQINKSFTQDEAKAILRCIKIDVPITFGNVDLTLKDKNFDLLVHLIVKLCKTYKQSKRVTIDDTVDVRILTPKESVGSAIGNILVYEKHTKLYKFSNTYTAQKHKAKKLFVKLKNLIPDLHEYRFDIKTTKFPKLTFDCRNIVRDFFNKLVICANQCTHFEVEQTLKAEIKKFYNNSEENNLAINADAIYQCYHGLIQNWWISPTPRTFLTKVSGATIFQQAIQSILQEPQMYALQNMFYNNKVKDKHYDYCKQIFKFESLHNYSRSIIVTDIPTLTTMKVIQIIKQKEDFMDHMVIDFENILNISTKDLSTLISELKDTAKILVIVFNTVNAQKTTHNRLNKLAEATETKTIILITSKDFGETVKEYFAPVDNVLFDDDQRLSDLTPESQKDILRNVHVLFQNQEVSLNLLIGDSTEFITGSILDKVIRNETIVIGESLVNANYEKIKHLYIERPIKPTNCANMNTIESIHGKYIKSFHDITDDAVLLTARPGLGKSTLLTHLSLKTKDKDNTFWIVRINLLDYSKQFCEWLENRTTVHCMEALAFLCKVILKDEINSIALKETNNKVQLDGCIDNEWNTFQLNVFLHFYNERRLILLFDGFDEICPHYKQKVLEFFEAVINLPQKNKMWVTSRPYTEILPDLQRLFNKIYELEGFSKEDQNEYLYYFWKDKMNYKKINDIQTKNLKSFLYKPVTALRFGFFEIFYHLYISLQDATYWDTFVPWILRIDMGQNENNIVTETPLVLYLLADYAAGLFFSDNFNIEWELYISIHSVYKMFIESMLKKILFQDKNKMDIYNPDIIKMYEKDRNDCITMHKKLAAYALLDAPIFRRLGLQEFIGMHTFKTETELKAVAKTIKNGTEKTGLISHVTSDNIPVFIHKTFTEYFAAEFVCDILKSDEFDDYSKKLIYAALGICGCNEIYNWISEKRRTDDKLYDIIKHINMETFCNQEWFDRVFSLTDFSTDFEVEQIVRLKASSPKDYEHDNLDSFDDYKHIKHPYIRISKGRVKATTIYFRNRVYQTWYKDVDSVDEAKDWQ